MKSFTRITALALCLGGMARAEVYETLSAEASGEELVTEQVLSPGLYSGTFLEPFKVRDCWYFVSAEIPGMGAPSALTVRRLPTPHCEGASRILAWSYNRGAALLATQKGDELVVAYGVQTMWPRPNQGSIQLFHISADTLENLRPNHGELMAGGAITASRMYFDGHRLVVQGSRMGTLPGETGSGQYYTATFEHFLTSDTAPHILAHPEAPPAEPSPTVGESAYIPLEGLYHLPFKVKGCWYFATARQLFRGWGLAQLTLSRLPLHGCEGKSVALGTSYDPRTFLVTTKGESAIAMAWSVRIAPEFVTVPIPTDLKLYNVSPDTLDNLRTVNSQLSSSGDGKVYATQLDFDGHRLVVQGTKTGVLLGGESESGSGPNYTATFEHFLNSDAPASVVAY